MKFSVGVSLLVVYSLAHTEGLDIRKTWSSMGYPYNHQPPEEQDSQVHVDGSITRRPSNVMRPVVKRIGVRSFSSQNHSPSSSHEYLTTPIRWQKRVVITKSRARDVTKNVSELGNGEIRRPVDKTINLKRVGAGLAHVPVTKIEELKEAIEEKPLLSFEKDDEEKLILLEKAAEVKEVIEQKTEEFKEAIEEKFPFELEKDDGGKDNLPEKADELKEIIDEKVEELKEAIEDKSSFTLEKDDDDKDILLEKATEVKEVIQRKIEELKEDIEEKSLVTFEKDDYGKDSLLDKADELKEVIKDKIEELTEIIEEKPLLTLEKTGENKNKDDLLEKATEWKEDFQEKIEELKEPIEDKAPFPLEKFDEDKNSLLEKAADVKEAFDEKASELKEDIQEKGEDFKETIEEKSPPPLEKDEVKSSLPEKGDELKEVIEELKEAFEEKISLEKEKVKSSLPEKGDELKEVIEEKSPFTLEKADEEKDSLLEKAVQLKEAFDEKASELKEDIQEKEDLKETIDTLKNTVIEGILEKIENAKEMEEEKTLGPIEKIEEIKTPTFETPMQKLEEMKGMLEEKVEDIEEKFEETKQPTVEPPVDKLEEVKRNLINNLLDKAVEFQTVPKNITDLLKDALDGKMPSPLEKVDELKQDVAEKLESIKEENVVDPKDAISGIITEKLDEIKSDVADKMEMPSEKMEEIKEIVTDKILDKMEGLKETATEFDPLEKLKFDKEVVLEKVQEPMDKITEMTEKMSDKVDIIDEIKENIGGSSLVKAETILDPKEDMKDMVFNAFHKSIVGDRKEYFKHAISSMDKDELHDLHEALSHAFNLKGFIMPTAENGAKEDLKLAVHELADKSGGDKETKDMLIEIEHSLEPNATITEKDEKDSDPTEGTTESKDNYVLKKMEKGKNMGRRWRRGGGAPPNRRHNAEERSSSNHQGWGGGRGRGRGRDWGRERRSVTYETGYGFGIIGTSSTPSSDSGRVTPPARLRQPIKTAYRQINNAGPPEPYPRSKSALDLPVLSIHEPLIDNILLEIKEGMRYILQTENDWTLAVHGTGHTGCHAVLDNLIENGDKVLALITGYWGNVMANMSERLGAQVVRYNTDPGKVFSLQEIEAAIRAQKPDLVLIVHGESDTSVGQPLDGIGNICAQSGCLLVVDVVSTAGTQPVLMDKNKIDAVFTNSHKGLGGVAGLAPVSLSPRAVQKIKNRLTPPRAYQTDLTLQYEVWNTNKPDRVRFQSVAVQVLYGLREALATIADEKMENTFKRHEQAKAQLNRGVAALGLQHYVERPEDRMVGITVIKPPKGKDPVKIAKYMFNNYNIAISSGFGPTEGQVLRFATFASQADIGKVNNILRALKNALASRETDI